MHDPFFLGPWLIAPAARELSDGKVQITLSPRAVGVLIRLCQVGTQTVSREELLDTVWPDVTVSDESLTQAVSELRRAFRSRADDAEIIATVPKTGYRLLTEPVPCGNGAPRTSLDSPAISLEAYCLVLQAHAAIIRDDNDALDQAISLSRQAVGLSPDSAMANAVHSIMLAHKTLYGGGDHTELRFALNYAETAVSIGPKSSISHAAKGFSLGALGQFQDATVSLARSVLLNDNQGEAHYLAARSALASGNHQSAFMLALKAADLVADAPRPLFLAARAAHTFDPALSKRIARRCVRQLQSRLANDPEEPRSISTLGPALGLAGEIDQATHALKLKPVSGTPCPIHRALGFAAIKDDQRALEHLEQAIDEGYRDSGWLESEPLLSHMRGARRFQRLTGMIAAT